MDSERFDRLVRSFGQPRSRRQTLRGLAGAAAAGALAVGGRDASADGCKGTGKTCKKDSQCCSGLICVNPGSQTNSPKKNSSRCGVGEPNTCANSTSFCDPDESPCGGENSDCKCVPTMSGGSLCVFSIRCLPDQTTCQTDVDCRFAGEVCIPPAATKGCSFQCGGNGNACATPCGPDSTRAAARAEREGGIPVRPRDR